MLLRRQSTFRVGSTGRFSRHRNNVCRQNTGDVLGRHEHARERSLRHPATVGIDPAVDRLRVLVRPAATVPEERQKHAVDRRHGSARRRPERRQQQADKLLRRGELDVPGGGADIEYLQDDAGPTLGIVW